MEKIYDPDLYAQLSAKPFESSETAQKSLNSFFSEVRELRAKYGLRDVATVVVVPVMTKDETGTECIGEVLQGYHNGDPTLYSSILYTAYIKSQMSATVDTTVDTIADLLSVLAAVAKEQALKFIADGDVKVDDRLLSKDEAIPNQAFTITFKGIELAFKGIEPEIL